jgi:cytosine/adenosine deaminase-related metal-dependent hydrolase
VPAKILRARWVLPIDGPPLKDGWVEYEHGRVIHVGTGRPSGPVEDLGERGGDVALLPGLVNAHTHLELSWLAGRVPPAISMVEWIQKLLMERGSGPPGGAAGAKANQAVANAVQAVRASGTALVGEVTNTLGTAALLDSAQIGGVLFHELIGFMVADPGAVVRGAWARISEVEQRERQRQWMQDAAGSSRLQVAPPPTQPSRRSSVVAHAPYSVSPALFGEIARRRGDAPLTVHLGESPEEVEFLHTGRGPLRDLLEQLGVWDPSWTPPACDPVEYLQRVGYLHEGCLVVHGVHLTQRDLALLREKNSVVVTCPRSNVWVGVGLPPVTRFFDEGLRVAIGTDSLASASSLSMFDELAELRRIAPEVDAGRLLESATKIGAEALGFPEFGSIRPGQRAVFAAVRLPAGTTDVEEHLVSGVRASDISLMT